MYDIVIVGGPQVQLWHDQYKVLLIEKRTFQESLYGGLQKCCGGLLDPDIIYKNMKKPFMYNKVLRKYIMQSGIQSIKQRRLYVSEY